MSGSYKIPVYCHTGNFRCGDGRWPLTWIKAWVSLSYEVLDIFSKFSLFPKILASNCLFLCKMIFFFWQVARLKWSCDWPRPKSKEIWSFKLQDVNVLENSRFFVQNFYLTWLYVVLNGVFVKMFYSFIIISNFCLVPVPLQRIYVVIEAKEINLSNPF